MAARSGINGRAHSAPRAQGWPSAEPLLAGPAVASISRHGCCCGLAWLRTPDAGAHGCAAGQGETNSQQEGAGERAAQQSEQAHKADSWAGRGNAATPASTPACPRCSAELQSPVHVPPPLKGCRRGDAGQGQVVSIGARRQLCTGQEQVCAFGHPPAPHALPAIPFRTLTTRRAGRGKGSCTRSPSTTGEPAE